jgi:hypothetical protein
MTRQYGQSHEQSAPMSYGQRQNGLGMAAIICAL